MGEAYKIMYSGDDRAAWLRLRRQGIGASEAACVLGESTYGSPMSVFAEKISTEEPVEEQSERMEWGQTLEPVILDEFADRSKRVIQLAGQLLRSVRWPFMQCTLDGKQWDEFFNEMSKIKPLTLADLRRCAKMAAYDMEIPEETV